MKISRDGPSNALFNSLPFHGNTTMGRLLGANISDLMKKNLKFSPQNECIAWGIPFKLNEILLVEENTESIFLNPIKTKCLVIMHTTDLDPLECDSHGFVLPPVRGEGRLGEHVADYIFMFNDGTETIQPIRRRFQVGSFNPRWGEGCVEAVPHHKPFPYRASHNIENTGWGLTQTQVSPSDRDKWTNWLWAWQNPHPEKMITGIRIEPIKGPIVFMGLTSGEISSQPLRWQTRKKAMLRLPHGVSFTPELDEDGLLKQIQLDMGQIISAIPQKIYPNASWSQTYNNKLPEISPERLMLEYTAHPDANFHLWDGRIISVKELEAEHIIDTMVPVAPANQRVNLRVVEQNSGKIVAVKLHIHGEAGEYLTPLDRHRTPNSGWFEDFSVDFAHLDTHYCSYIPGTATLNLPLGKIYVEVSKGFEITPVRKIIEVTRSTEEITIEIEKVLPWREKNWVSADTHVHFLSPISALLEGAAEGVNVINLLASQWGELMTNAGDFDGKTTWGSQEAGGEGEYLVRVGTENRQHILGHISLLGYSGDMILPMTSGGADESALGDPIEVLLTEWARQCKKQGGLVILPHFPRPRMENAISILNKTVDAVEMTAWDQLYNGINPYSLSDWYRYLNCGYLVAAVGGTDKMSASMAVGTVRTYARIPESKKFTYENWMEAVRGAETFVTYGPLLEFFVEGKPMGSTINMTANGGTVDITWQVATVTVPISRVELVVNGEIRESISTSPNTAVGNWTIKIEKSSWLALLVRGHYADKSEIIAAHSSPVMVLVEGSEMLPAADALTILDQIEGTMTYFDTIGTRAEDSVYKRMRLVLESAHRTLHNRMHKLGYFHNHTPATDHTKHYD